MSTWAFDVEATEDHLALVAAIEEFVAGEACRLAIVTHVGLPSFARASYSCRVARCRGPRTRRGSCFMACPPRRPPMEALFGASVACGEVPKWLAGRET